MAGRRRKLRRWLLGVVLVPFALGLLPGVPHPLLPLSPLGAPTPPRADVPAPNEGGERVLVLAPHPDDEVLGAGGAIVDLLAQGAQVLVVFLTNGDANTAAKHFFTWNPLHRAEDFQSLGYRRMKEAGKALQILGVPPDHALFLGYPDRGLLSLLTTHWDVPYRSPYTRRDRPFYRNSFNPEARYTGADLLRDLCAILEAFRPTLVYGPHPDDGHPDHRAAAAFLRRALAESGLTPEVRYYLVHAPRWPLPRRLDPSRPLAAPDFLLERWEWQELPVSATAAEKKLQALRAYGSQRLTNGRFLAAFVRQNELFARDNLSAAPSR
ncbi:MAG: PIG-L family deacetylase [Candidatus Bipolaricaulota bacterium]|nr:PIG-L family deacetylase [Candidatus Bipolaricaulota bacterium]